MDNNVIKINDVEYVRRNVSQGKTRIVILQRGWVFVGNYYQDGHNCTLENASVIRSWGTTKGLGEIAENGPTAKTVLDKCNTVRFHELTIIATIDCREENWKCL